MLFFAFQTVFSQSVTLVRPGDTNADGKVDLWDVAPIALNYKQTGPPRAIVLTHPVDTLFYAAPDWTPLPGSPIDAPNPKHADCNGDGTIDDKDLAFVFAQATPMQTPLPFTNHVYGNTGLVSGESLELEMRPLIDQITLEENCKVKIPVEIVLGDLPRNKPSLDLLGVAWSGPVTESTDYNILSVEMDYSSSDLFDSPLEAISQDLYHQHIPIQTGMGCTDTDIFPSESAIFRKNGIKKMHKGDRLGVDIVVLIEPMCSQTGSWELDSLAVLISQINVLAYAEDDNGNLEIYGNDCKLDTMWIFRKDIPGLGGSGKRAEWVEEENLILHSLKVYSNPIQQGEELRLRVLAEEGGKGEIVLTNAQGIPILQRKNALVQGQNDLRIPLGGIPSGVYMLRVKLKGAIMVSRVVII